MKKNNGKAKKRVMIFGGTGLLLTGGILLATSSCEGEKKVVVDKENSISDTTVTTVVTQDTTTTTKTFVTTTKDGKTEEVQVPVETTNTSDVNYDTTVELKPIAKTQVTIEDLVKMTKEYTKYVNEEGTFSHKNYVHGKFDEENIDLSIFAAAYLANIDYVSAEDTNTLIANGYIKDTIENVVIDSFDFYAFYTDDTVNKIKDGNTNVLDLSLIMNDKKGKDAFATMNGVIKSFNTNTQSQNLKNYKDTVFYYIEGVTVNKDDYNYSDSIFTEDKEALGVGSDYTMDYAAISVAKLAHDYDVEVPELETLFKASREDLADVYRLFYSYTAEQEKCYTKTK